MNPSTNCPADTRSSLRTLVRDRGRRADLHRRPARLRPRRHRRRARRRHRRGDQPGPDRRAGGHGHRRAGPLLVHQPAARRVRAALRAVGLHHRAAREPAGRGRPHHPGGHRHGGRHARAGGDGHRRGPGRRRRQRRVLDQLHPGAAAEHPDGAAVVLRRRHLRAGGAHQPGAQRLALHHLRVEQRPEPVPVRRRRHLGGVQRRRLGLPEPRHHAGGAGQGDRRLGRVPQLPGRRRQHRDQVGQQRLPRDAQRLRDSRRLGRQQHAQRAVPLHRALQPAGHLRARRPRSSATACGSTASSRPRARRRPASASIRTSSAPAARTTSRSSS